MSIPFGYGAQPTSQQIALRRILFVDRYAGIKPSSPDSTDSGLQELPAVHVLSQRAKREHAKPSMGLALHALVRARRVGGASASLTSRE